MFFLSFFIAVTLFELTVVNNWWIIMVSFIFLISYLYT